MTGPVHVAPISEADFDGWSEGVRRRFAEPRVAARTWAPDEAPAHAVRLLAALLPNGLATDGHHVVEITREHTRIGHAWLRVRGPEAFIFDLTVTEQALDRDLAHAALHGVHEVAAGLGASLSRINVFRSDSVLSRIVESEGFHVTNDQMRLHLDRIEPDRHGSVGAEVDLRAMSEAEFAAFVTIQAAGYAAGLVRSRQASSIEDALVLAEEENTESFPNGAASADQILMTAYTRDTAVGTLWMELVDDFDGPRAYISDLYVKPEFRRRGYGRAIMAAAERKARDCGAVVVALSVFGFNHGARALYEQAGFVTTEQMLWKDLPDVR